MILEKIKEANDVKQLSLSECEQLAQEIRDFLIRSLSETRRTPCIESGCGGADHCFAPIFTFSGR